MNSISLISLVLAFQIVNAAPIMNAGHKDNGGDTVRCSKSKLNSFHGTYSLDYFANYLRFKNKFQKVATIEDSFKRTEELIKKVPLLEDGFGLFRRDFMVKPVVLGHGGWQSGPTGLHKIDDQILRRRLPKNCKLYQAVRREDDGYVIIYHYDKVEIESLKKKNSTSSSLGAAFQFSMLVHHEWLWKITHDVDAIYKLNGYLHSNLWENKSSFNVLSEMMSLGLPDEFLLTSAEYKAQDAVRTKLRALEGRFRDSMPISTGNPDIKVMKGILQDSEKLQKNFKTLLKRPKISYYPDNYKYHKEFLKESLDLLVVDLKEIIKCLNANGVACADRPLIGSPPSP